LMDRFGTRRVSLFFVWLAIRDTCSRAKGEVLRPVRLLPEHDNQARAQNEERAQSHQRNRRASWLRTGWDDA
jgi:hypothetical protein